MDTALRAKLSAIVGESGVGAFAAVHPANVTQLREVLITCVGAGASVAPVGSPRSGRADVVIAVDRLDAIRVDAAAMLAHVGAAAPWTAVREAVTARRLAVAGLPSLRSERVGESIALGEVAHRVIAGIDLFTPAGELISNGGRTLKDVVGFDLAGLALGSGQRLGLVISVTLRLEPAGAGTPPEPAPGEWRGDAGVDLVAAFTS